MHRTWLAYCLVGWLVGWLADWLTHWLSGQGLESSRAKSLNGEGLSGRGGKFSRFQHQGSHPLLYSSNRGWHGQRLKWIGAGAEVGFGFGQGLLVGCNEA